MHQTRKQKMPWYSPAELAKGMSAAANAAGEQMTAGAASVTKMVEDMDAAAKAMEEERKIKEVNVPHPRDGALCRQSACSWLLS